GVQEPSERAGAPSRAPRQGRSGQGRPRSGKRTSAATIAAGTSSPPVSPTAAPTAASTPAGTPTGASRRARRTRSPSDVPTPRAGLRRAARRARCARTVSLGAETLASTASVRRRRSIRCGTEPTPGRSIAGAATGQIASGTKTERAAPTVIPSGLMFEANAPSTIRMIDEMRIARVRQKIDELAVRTCGSEADADDLVANSIVLVGDPAKRPWDPAVGGLARHMGYVMHDVWIAHHRRAWTRREVVDTDGAHEAPSRHETPADEALIEAE